MKLHCQQDNGDFGKKLQTSKFHRKYFWKENLFLLLYKEKYFSMWCHKVIKRIFFSVVPRNTMKHRNVSNKSHNKIKIYTNFINNRKKVTFITTDNNARCGRATLYGWEREASKQLFIELNLHCMVLIISNHTPYSHTLDFHGHLGWQTNVLADKFGQCTTNVARQGQTVDRPQQNETIILKHAPLGARDGEKRENHDCGMEIWNPGIVSGPYILLLKYIKITIWYWCFSYNGC